MNSIKSTPPKSLANTAIHLFFCEEKGNSQSILFTKLEGYQLLCSRDTQLRIQSVRSYPPYGVAPPYLTSAMASNICIYSVGNSSFHRVESPRYEHSSSKRHCARKIERDSCKSYGDSFSQFYYYLLYSTRIEDKERRQGFDVGRLRKIS